MRSGIVLVAVVTAMALCAPGRTLAADDAPGGGATPLVITLEPFWSEAQGNALERPGDHGAKPGDVPQNQADAAKSDPEKPSAKDVMAEALKQAKARASTAGAAPAETSSVQAGSSEALARELAALKRSTGSGGGQGETGPGGGGGGATLQVYAHIVTMIIKKNWRFSSKDAGGKQGAVVELHIGKDGRILKYVLVQSSGMPAYDTSVLNAVKAAEALPPPPLPSLSVLNVNFSPSDVAR
ncbi:MAG: energy transducer TonB [Desulfovibrionaceae bacterium]|nr:energy transducer TonB [Desulfovibrionaceae bacterium]